MPWRPGRGGTICRVCKRHVSECGGLSVRGKCYDCGQGRQLACVLNMVSHSGPMFDEWRRGMAASVGGVLLDDVREQA